MTFISSSPSIRPPDAIKSSSSSLSSLIESCTLVGTVRGTKLWASDCAAPDQLRSSVTATESSEPPLQDQATEAITPGQK